MPIARPTIIECIRAVWKHWLLIITGGVLALVSSMWSVFVGQKFGREIFVILALVAFFWAFFAAWSSERDERCSLNDRVTAFETRPYAVQDLIVLNPTLLLGRGIALSVTNSGLVPFVITEAETLVSDSVPQRNLVNEMIPANSGSRIIGLPKFAKTQVNNFSCGLDIQVRLRVK